MNFRIYALTIGLAALLLPNAGAVTKEEALEKVNSLAAKVEGFRADLQIADTGAGVDGVSTSTIAVSKEHGFKTNLHANGVECQIITDFTTGYQYYPERQQAMKMTADRPEIRELFRKPATDMNPLVLLDQNSLKFKGEETLAGETVYRFEGTTTTQFLAQGEAVRRTMEAWVSTTDGLPRKTIETVGGNKATTIYSNVEVNPSFKAADFQFTPGHDVQVIDANEEIKKSTGQRQQAPARR